MKILDQKRPHDGSAGFSLVELMVAMVVLVVGIMATMGMQFIALAGYTASRDSTGATEVARSVEGLLHTESLQWNATDGLSSIKPAMDVFGTSALATVEGSGWEWTRLSTAPLDQSLTPNGPQRFCVYLRGGMMPGDGLVASNIIQVQMAVMYPGANTVFPNPTAQNPQGVCPSTADIASTFQLDPTNPDVLEVTGMRASYFGTQVFPKKR